MSDEQPIILTDDQIEEIADRAAEKAKVKVMSDEQIQHIAEKAAEVALNRVYTNVGRSVITRGLWLVGAATLAIWAFMSKDINFSWWKG